jgi:hypothetical protein
MQSAALPNQGRGDRPVRIAKLDFFRASGARTET